ncbi:hypothetical protein BGW80DRAFT_1384898, partial [Lactifluus volemus]
MPPPRNRAQCRICNDKESRYTCSNCFLEETECESPKRAEEPVDTRPTLATDLSMLSDDDGDVPLRPLTSLKWPYVPEESAYPDPLKRDDPKPLQTAQYEAIATSQAVRATLTGQPRLQELLRSVDRLRGSAREEAIQDCLGVSRSEVRNSDNVSRMGGGIVVGEEEKEAMR